jgi:hypothetical protein
MNIEGLPQASIIDEKGQMNSEWYNFFAINNQNFIQNFNQSGHLVPRRTSAEINALNGLTTMSGSLYNPNTNNEMTNSDGVYKNNTQNSIISNALSPPTPQPGRIEFYGDSSGNLTVNINGTLYQVSITPV